MNYRENYKALELQDSHREYRKNGRYFSYYDQEQFKKVMEEKSSVQVIGNVCLWEDERISNNRLGVFMVMDEKEVAVMYEIHEAKNVKCLGYVRVSEHMYLRVVEQAWWFPVPILIIGLTLAVIMVSVAIGMGHGKKNVESTIAYDQQEVADGEEWDGQMGNRAEDSVEEQENIEIPGYESLLVNHNNPTIALINTDANNVYLKYSIMIADGETIYDSKLIPPNKTVQWNVKESLSNGKYDLIFRISTYDMKTQQPYNGANQAVSLTVED